MIVQAPEACTLSSQFPECSMNMDQSQLMVQEVQFKIKMIKVPVAIAKFSDMVLG